MHLAGFVTWAFEFEGQPIFAGQRELQTHGIDEPELNFFRIAGLLSGDRIAATSSEAVPLDTILANGIRPGPDVDALATREGNNTAVMLWNYQDDAVPAPDTAVQVALRGIPANASRVLVEQYRIDTNHSNAFTAWQAMGSPQQPTIQQRSQLQAAGQLQLEGSPAWMAVHNGQIRILLAMPPESIGLLRITWTEAAIHPNR